MTLELEEWGNGETSFVIKTEDEEGHSKVYIHPWHRYFRTRDESHEVYISVGVYDPEGNEPEGIENHMWNIIVNREDFVEGLIQTFPELKRAND